MVFTCIRKDKHTMVCVTGVYLSDITDIIFSILHLNVSPLSICSSCCTEVCGFELLKSEVLVSCKTSKVNRFYHKHTAVESLANCI